MIGMTTNEQTAVDTNGNAVVGGSVVGLVYCPTAVYFQGEADALTRGGGGGYVSAEKAAALGATNIRPGTWHGDLMADWPQSYWQA